MLFDLQILRDEKAISVRQLQQKTGIPKSTISKMENGRSIPRLDQVCKMAKALEVKPTHLFSVLIEGESWNRPED